MNKSIGVILGLAALVILVVFFLFDSSKRDMMIGKWYTQEGVLEFHDNNDVTSPDFEDAIWILSDNEEIIDLDGINHLAIIILYIVPITKNIKPN